MENLSRGMQQKVALARALLTSPVLLLLDEPTTGLDPRSKLEVQEFVREMRAEHDATILLCTHDMAEAEALADRIGILDRGELLFLEPVDDVKRRFGVATLEEAFFAATGRKFEDEHDEPTRQGGVRDELGYRDDVRHELIGLAGIVERNVYLAKRYFLVGPRVLRLDGREHAHDRLHREGVEATGGRSTSSRLATMLLIGAVIWAYLGIIFEFLTETVAWERWEGTIEYTFMAPISRPVHLFGMAAFAVLYGLVRRDPPLRVVAAFFGLAHARTRTSATALRAARDRVALVHRDRDHDRGAAADLAREGRAARLHRAGHDARRLGRLLPGVA